MADGIWTAVSGAMAQDRQIETVANNLANMDTLGFKKDQATFKEYLSNIERDHEPGDIKQGPITDKDFYQLQGKDKGYVVNDATYTDFRQGHLKVTQAPLDLALDGPGFFEVSTPNGTRYTRQGSFKVAKDGILVTTEGHPVLAFRGGQANAQPVDQLAVQPGQGRLETQGGVGVGRNPADAARFINVGDYRGVVTISTAGEIYAGEDLMAKLSVVEFDDRKQLQKEGGLLFVNKLPENQKANSTRTVVRQGMLETSNVNPAEEMTKMIKAHRQFEQDLKAIKTYDQMMSKAVNEVGKL